MATAAKQKRLRLREDWSRQSSPCRVDREAGIIHDVKVLGSQSANRRRYPAETIKKAVKNGLYEGAKVFADHPGKNGEQRPVRGILGKLHGIYEKGGELYAARFHILKSHPLADSVFEDCERGLGVFGLSHNAEAGDYHFEAGVQVVTEILRVESVDLVSSPATNTNLWEGRTVGVPLKDWLDEKSADRTLPPKRRRLLLEMAAQIEQDNDEGPIMPDVPAPELDGRQLLAQAVAALVQSGDAADHDLAQKVMKLLKPEAPVEEDDDTDEDPDVAGKKPKEGKKPRAIPQPAVLTEQEAQELCALADVPASRPLVESLAGLTEAKARQVVLAHKQSAAALRRGSGPPRSASGHVPEASSDRAPADRGRALQWLKE